MMTFYPTNLSTKRLYQFRQKYARQLAHKRAVVERHQPGTTPHTRASREADEYERRIAQIDGELVRRGVNWL